MYRYGTHFYHWTQAVYWLSQMREWRENFPGKMPDHDGEWSCVTQFADHVRLATSR